MVNMILRASRSVEKHYAAGPGFADRAPFAKTPDVIDERIEILMVAPAVRIDLPCGDNFLHAIAVDVSNDGAGNLRREDGAGGKIGNEPAAIGPVEAIRGRHVTAVGNVIETGHRVGP